MKRFCGMMPSDEIEKRVQYVDEEGLHIFIDVGKHGWTIHWADMSTTYGDKDATTEENFKEAYEKLIRHLKVTEVNPENQKAEVCDCMEQ